MDTILISNDTFDQIEALTEQLNDTVKLEEKINLHTKLDTYIKDVEKSLDAMCNIVENIDFDATCNDNKNIENYNIDSVNLDNLLSELKDESVLQTKIKYMEQILEHVKKCKKMCEKNKLVIAKCN